MSERRPNIILIMSDQQRADTLGLDGNDHMVTPNLDKLVDEGAIFRQCFAQGACCTTTRASAFSGKYPHELDLLANVPWDGRDNWVELLQQAGYQTASIGKMHLQPLRASCGFEYRFVCENKTHLFAPDNEPDDWVKHLAENGLQRPLDYRANTLNLQERLGDTEFPLDEDLHGDVFIGNNAVEWIRRCEDGRPLFLHIGFTGPENPYDSPQRYKDMYLDRHIPPPKSKLGELYEKPPEQRRQMLELEMRIGGDTFRGSRTDAEGLRRMRAAYFAGVTLIDEYIGKILHALETQGLLDDAIVIYCSDHGDAIGDNELMHNWFMYDSVTRVPLLLWGPKYFAPVQYDCLVELFDIAPTILGLASLPVRPEIHARSLLPVLEGEKSFAPKEHVFCEEKHMVMVRSEEWKLVYYHGKNYGELYDLLSDPNESNNLFNDPSCRPHKAKLVEAMEDWYARTGGPAESLLRYI